MNRFTTLLDLLRHFASRERLVLLPILVILLLTGLLLFATGGLSVVAPLVYTVF